MGSGMVAPMQAGVSQKTKRKRAADHDSGEESIPKKAAGKARSTASSSVKMKKVMVSPVSSPPSRTTSGYSTPQVARKPAKSPRIMKERLTSSPHTSSQVKREGGFQGLSLRSGCNCWINSLIQLEYAPAPSLGGYVKKEEQPQPLVILSGEYVVEDINVNADARIDVFKDTNRGVWWANAILNMDDDEHQFVIKMDPGPEAGHLGHAVTLGWRMRSMYTEEVKFGSGCTGEATFFENGNLMIDLHNVPGLGNVEMSGHRMHGPSRPGDLQQDWDHFRRIAYGR